ncbi:Nicotianamine synthase [Linum grandiflorum]
MGSICMQEQDKLVAKVCQLYDEISSLETLKPSEDVNSLFTELVHTCMPPNPIDVDTDLFPEVQEIRSKLIVLCGQAEGYLESHYSAILGSYPNPLDHLEMFPYYNNYLKLSLLEFTLLKESHPSLNPKKVAFLGSGPLPLTSIVLATKHLTNATFHNYDIDHEANELASGLVSSDQELSPRMVFHTKDVMEVTDEELGEFDVVFLAALVGMDKKVKVKVIRHLGKHMRDGAVLMLRSAHGARGFLYPVVKNRDLEVHGFEVDSVFHPMDEVINSVVIAHKQGRGVAEEAAMGA